MLLLWVWLVWLSTEEGLLLSTVVVVVGENLGELMLGLTLTLLLLLLTRLLLTR